VDRNDIEIVRLNEEIADLKAEIVELSGKVASDARGGERSVRPSIAAIRENPGTVTSVAVTAGLIGVALGYVIGASDSAHAHLRWR
jgi:hypothetical protein